MLVIKSPYEGRESFVKKTLLRKVLSPLIPQRVKRHLTLYRTLIANFGRPTLYTEPEGKRVLVLAPHSDGEVIGAASLALWRLAGPGPGSHDRDQGLGRDDAPQGAGGRVGADVMLALGACV